jgi:hypothetical protein
MVGCWLLLISSAVLPDDVGCRFKGASRFVLAYLFTERISL